MSSAPIQFRAILDEGERTLQWRHAFAVDASGAFCPGVWSDWESVEEWSLMAAYRADEEERTERRLKELYGD